MEESVKLVVRKLSGSSGPVVTDSESLQGWLMKFGEDSTRMRTSVETFVDWLANGSLPWVNNFAFMSGQLIVIYKQIDVRPVGLGETWWTLFSKIIIDK